MKFSKILVVVAAIGASFAMSGPTMARTVITIGGGSGVVCINGVCQSSSRPTTVRCTRGTNSRNCVFIPVNPRGQTITIGR
jgi:hypothetical protein